MMSKAPCFLRSREEVESMTELLGQLIAILDVIGLEAFVPEAARGAGRPPEYRRGVARAPL
jgi:hypothetical protein